MGGKVTLRSALVNPATVGTAMGLTLFLTGWRPPAPVDNTISFLADLNTPLPMIVLGAQMAGADLRTAFTNRRLYLVAAVRLVAAPLIALLVLLPLRLEPMSYCACVVLCAVPPAGATAMFAQKLAGTPPWPPRPSAPSPSCPCSPCRSLPWRPGSSPGWAESEGGTFVSAREEFIEIYTANIHREGADALLDYLEHKSDFFTSPASAGITAPMRAGCASTASMSTTASRPTWPGSGSGGLRPGGAEESAAIAALLHDLCKAGCYRAGSRNVKGPDGKWTAVPTYFYEDPLPYGHGEKSVYIISGF